MNLVEVGGFGQALGWIADMKLRRSEFKRGVWV